MKKLSSLMVLIFLLVLQLAAQNTDVPWEIAYQGILTDSTGTPVPDGTYDLTFTFYPSPDPNSSTPLITETHEDVQVKDGLFNVLLGSTRPEGFFPEIWFYNPIEFGIKINGGEELKPHIIFHVVPTAITSLYTARNSVNSPSVIDSSLRLYDLSPIGASTGDVIKYDGSKIKWGQTPGLSFPYTGSYTQTPTLGLNITETTLTNNPVAYFNYHGGSSQSLVDIASRNFGIQIDTAYTGIRINNSNEAINILRTHEGLYIGNSKGDGIRMQSVSSEGLDIRSAGNNGVSVDNATNAGMYVNDCTYGLYTNTPSHAGLYVYNSGGPGVWINRAFSAGLLVANSETGISVYANSNGVYSVGDYDNDGNGFAGNFQGDVFISGILLNGTAATVIDHPDDPENKKLTHVAVESPDMLDIYNGNVQLNGNGEAWVNLPVYFESLNKDFRYQLTAIGAPGPNLYVARKISGNQFKIAGGEPGSEVSWQVTGIRNDPYSQKVKPKVVSDKENEERGYYIHPEAYGLSRDRNYDFAKHEKQKKELADKNKLN